MGVHTSDPRLPCRCTPSSSRRHSQLCQMETTTAAGCALAAVSRPALRCDSAAAVRASPTWNASRCGSCTPRAAGALKPLHHSSCEFQNSCAGHMSSVRSLTASDRVSAPASTLQQGGDPLQLLPAAIAGLAAGVLGPAARAARHDGASMRVLPASLPHRGALAQRCRRMQVLHGSHTFGVRALARRRGAAQVQRRRARTVRPGRRRTTSA